MTNILLPTDFSDNAWSAAVYALKLYANEACTFYFLNSTKFKASATRSYITTKYIETLRDEALQELSDLKKMARVANANANHKFEIIASDKNLETAINSTLLLHDIELVVMGTKGATGAKELFFGSNTIHIINNIKDCPVLVVPDEYDFAIPKEIAFPTGFNRYYSHIELDPLRTVSALYDSKIKIIHINTEDHLTAVQKYNKEMLHDYLKQYEHSFHWLPKYTKKASAINEFIIDLNINLLVMVNYKHSFIEKILKEPVVKNIGFQPIVPFLVIPA
ncbi:universal stress protein [Lacinutrix neustonica]|uniref:Universal stress protein n=1 Tax=Lacinutrix neustonica TaxID=2980107 RepID=A0A9E8MXZ2_9FLAO|nr:universal stress protein [Lacinutrix neustonica]WAC02325.1 universal stress protein [Lacinutrix neustonica]